MKGRDAKGALSADLLVCFPSRTSLTLMPKSICSPARSLEAKKHHINHNQQLVKRGRTKSFSQGSPMLWAKTKAMGAEISEPTSPKVTCAGQIKVRHKTGSIKSWQSVMEEIERIHKNKKHKKTKPSWAEALGFKKDVMHFLTCLRRIRFDFRCFGSFPRADITSDDEDDDEEEEEDREENHAGVEGSEGTDENSRTVFSKWYMVLQENQSDVFCKQDRIDRDDKASFGDDGSTSEVPSVPPPNALLLMRCRSAPAKSWLEEKGEEENNDHEEKEDKQECQEANISEKQERKGKITLKSLMDEEKMKKMNENLVVMTYGSDLYNISTEIAKETWVVGGMKDPISRSRSWKR
ncbi:hypothetical protein ACLB2K_053594 [Fragaria x ananassa]